MTKTWDEVVRRAAWAACDTHYGAPTWPDLADWQRRPWLDMQDAALRALIAAGHAIVPREATEAMIKANMEPRGSVYPCPSNHTALIREWNAALTAGEIKPEGE